MVDKLESKPDSDGRQKVLAEELSAAGAPEDAELVRERPHSSNRSGRCRVAPNQMLTSND